MSRDLSRDHVVPVSHGGRDSWTNSVTACKKCNIRKANRTPEQAGMPLIYVPYVPNRHEQFILRNRRILADQMDICLRASAADEPSPAGLRSRSRLPHAQNDARPLGAAIVGLCGLCTCLARLVASASRWSSRPRRQRRRLACQGDVPRHSSCARWRSRRFLRVARRPSAGAGVECGASSVKIVAVCGTCVVARHPPIAPSPIVRCHGARNSEDEFKIRHALVTAGIVSALAARPHSRKRTIQLALVAVGFDA
jgi:hypothetical protein